MSCLGDALSDVSWRVQPRVRKDHFLSERAIRKRKFGRAERLHSQIHICSNRHACASVCFQSITVICMLDRAIVARTSMLIKALPQNCLGRICTDRRLVHHIRIVFRICVRRRGMCECGLRILWFCRALIHCDSAAAADVGRPAASILWGRRKMIFLLRRATPPRPRLTAWLQIPLSG